MRLCDSSQYITGKPQRWSPAAAAPTFNPPQQSVGLIIISFPGDDSGLIFGCQGNAALVLAYRTAAVYLLKQKKSNTAI